VIVNRSKLIKNDGIPNGDGNRYENGDDGWFGRMEDIHIDTTLLSLFE
jgi:hypothetical protein